nr:hypothetical protein [uncultured Anaerocolumna sp.]
MFDKEERWSAVQVDPNKIKCKTCKFKNGGMRYPHYTKGSCEMYPSPSTKPHDVLFEGADCVFYEKEKE